MKRLRPFCLFIVYLSLANNAAALDVLVCNDRIAARERHESGDMPRSPPAPLYLDVARPHCARMRAIVRQRWENQISTETASRKSWMRSISAASSGPNSNAGGM